jgi:branched-chain amino acid aminotransferase
LNATVFVNGRIADAATASIPVFDHGFLYGEGVYETLRTYHRIPFLYDLHQERLRRSAALLALPVPFTDDELLAQISATMAAHKGLNEAYIRVLLTRGVGELSYNPAACPTPSTVIIVKPFPEPPARTFTDGIKVALVGVRRNHPAALNPMIKSNNLINNALAMQEALRAGADEALMCNQAGDVVECSQSNFFIVKDRRVITPPLDAGLLPGVTRAFVLEMARDEGFDAVEEAVSVADVRAADEAFITGTTREVTPVVSVDTHRIGTGRPGAVSRQLMAAFHARVKQLIPTS